METLGVGHAKVDSNSESSRILDYNYLRKEEKDMQIRIIWEILQ